MMLRALAAAALVVLLAAPAQAAPPANQVYYTVTAAYQGAPETLWEIATRFLGNSARAGEILELNSGRVQPDGDRLADAGRLHDGWILVLPWDAVGTELHYGPLPSAAGSSSGCERPNGTPAAAAWGQTLLAPAKAWPVANGAGVKVAIIGSGVDGATPELAGRVTAGADVGAGAGRADNACDGSGTALAGLVAGNDDTFGVAPGARIIPIKVGAGSQQLATAIDVAVAAGARVILVTAGDAADAAVRAATSEAISRDVVVVLPVSTGGTQADGLLRAGAIGEDRRVAEEYPADRVDVLAPGVEVASIGGAVTGPEFAAASVAGTVALVRSAHPELHAADVTRQVRSTATDGVVNPVAAVTTALPSGVGVNAADVKPTSSLGTLSQVLLWIAVALAVCLLLPFVLQRPARRLAGLAKRAWAKRQAQRARARMLDDGDNDPFWEPPSTASSEDRDEITEVIHPAR
ncbi:S8 family serine peptidase [Paractinoplanes durhamensis]|uniref:Peptidase S8/S53 domain-containing protein n=1 Tax=Paractinoplanes durhamensis TaxID=113563 RepID=A0ABQ3Z1Q9_9ACTN|nr:S8 family serine peptidase [Actinoplanes durhamensis]GIE03770.1 hypothetical protein Adu01nite_51200 [Actinoplanes durhamensis]